ncbi:MAG: protein translocase SEC61 complex subunit gamma [Thaumarchaeota archaeon]|nr:protein translocase SEC61 complex subunit gamma [Nitrososphaerota archaeon]
MGVRDMLRAMMAVFRLSKKSDRTEFMLYLKLVALGVAVIGFIGFIIKFISAALPSVFG